MIICLEIKFHWHFLGGSVVHCLPLGNASFCVQYFSRQNTQESLLYQCYDFHWNHSSHTRDMKKGTFILKMVAILKILKFDCTTSCQPQHTQKISCWSDIASLRKRVDNIDGERRKKNEKKLDKNDKSPKLCFGGLNKILIKLYTVLRVSWLF